MNTSLTGNAPADAVNLTLVDKEGLQKIKKTGNPFMRQQLETHQFKPEFGSLVLILDTAGKLAQILVGIEQPPQDPRAMLQLFAKIANKLPASVCVALDPKALAADEWQQAALGWGLAGYQFERYKRKKDKKPAKRPLLVVPKELNLEEINAQLAAIFLARDLINTPAMDLTPAKLAEQVRQLADTHQGTCRVISGEDLLDANYPAVYAVGMGSDNPPALADLRWGDPDHPKLTLVGKGVVFDTGGLNLKPSSGMLLMKKDMGGAAVTIALAQLIMETKLPVYLRLLIPTVENAASGKAYRPSDCVSTRKGLHVEIGNTDAEGRVILCDALAEAVSEKPDLIIDMATLTGAARIALGQDLPGFYTNSDQLADALYKAAKQAADPVWRMPLWHPYRKKLKSSIADINNIASTSMGGSITAALYLYEFIKPFENWLHFDIYGWRTETIPGTPKGAEASALRAVFRFLKNRYNA